MVFALSAKASSEMFHPLKNIRDRNIKMLCKIMVALIPTGHGHYCSGAIARQTHSPPIQMGTGALVKGCSA